MAVMHGTPRILTEAELNWTREAVDRAAVPLSMYLLFWLQANPDPRHPTRAAHS